MLPNFIFKVEKWKFNKDYGVYVSTLGNFKDRHKRLLPIKVDQKGYCAVRTEQGYVKAHRLVMFTWKPIPNAEKLTVDHLNHNKRDNSVMNLEWVTRKENQRRAKLDHVKTEDSIEDKQPVYSPKLQNYFLVVGGQAFETVDEVYKWMRENAPKNNRKQVSKETLVEVFINQAESISKNNFQNCGKLYCGLFLTIVSKG